MDIIQPKHAEPYGPVVVHIIWSMAFGHKVYGPFEDETEAVNWVAENVPERTLFEIMHLHDRVWPQ